MKSVSPCAIAYAAVQVSINRKTEKDFTEIENKLRFALSSCNSWHVIDEDFDYDKFYHNITTFFEGVHTAQDKAFILKLLLWWNRYVPPIFCFAAGSLNLTALFLTVLMHPNTALRKPRRSPWL